MPWSRLLLGLLVLATPLSAQEWRTCTVIGGFQACAGLSMWEEQRVPTYPTGHFFGAIVDNSLGDYPNGYRITAWGFYHAGPTDLMFDVYYGPSNWGLGPMDWTKGFVFATGSQDNDWALGGRLFSGEYFAGFYNGDDNVSDLRFAWRGLTDDGVSFDCIQAGRSEECATTAPEPSTWLLLLTGLACLSLAYRRSRTAQPI